MPSGTTRLDKWENFPILNHMKPYSGGGGGGCCICCLVAGWPRSCFIFSGLKRPVEVLVVCHGEVDEGEGEEAGGGV